jgi:hypothetical protein
LGEINHNKEINFKIKLHYYNNKMVFLFNIFKKLKKSIYNLKLILKSKMNKWKNIKKNGVKLKNNIMKLSQDKDN